MMDYEREGNLSTSSPLSLSLFAAPLREHKLVGGNQAAATSMILNINHDGDDDDGERKFVA